MMPFSKNTLLIPEIGEIKLVGRNEYFSAVATAHIIKHHDTDWLVTAAHVLGGLEHIGVKANSPNGKTAQIAKMQTSLFEIHDTLDIAIVPLLRTFPNRGVPFLIVGTGEIFEPEQVPDRIFTEGAQIFVVGFPQLPDFPDTKEHRIDAYNPPTYPTVKHGYIARISDWLKGHANTIVIDCDIFPGNSGSPVITRQQLYQEKMHYMGMVTNFIPYIDERAGKEVRIPRFPFKQNSGYANIVPGIEIKRMIEKSGLLPGNWPS